MSEFVREPNPVQGLLNYINDIKPFHTKVVEILTEYVHTDDVAVTITEDFDIKVDLIFPTPAEQAALEAGSTTDQDDFLIGQLGTFGGTTPFGSPSEWLVTSQDFTAAGPFDPTNPGYGSTTNSLIIPGDRTAQYTPGKDIVVKIYDENDVLQFTGGDNYEIQTSTFTQPTNAQEIPHTVLTVNNIRDLSGTNTAGWYVTVELTPFDIDGVITGYGTAYDVFYTDVPDAGATTPEPPSQPAQPTPGPQNQTADEVIATNVPNENYYNPDNPSDPETPPIAGLPVYVNSFFISGDVTSTFVPGSILELVGTDDIFTVLRVVYDSVNTRTIIRTIETIPPGTTGQLKIRERIPGYDDIFIQSAQSDGTLSTNITEEIVFSWNDSDLNGTDVIAGYQFLIRTASGNDLVVSGDNVEGTVQPGDTVRIFESPSNDGTTYTVASVSGETITLDQTLNSESNGIVEKYEP